MSRSACVILGLAAIWALKGMGAPAGVPAAPTSWQCHVRCYRDSGSGGQTWLSEKNDLISACADFPQGVQAAIDIQCREIYGATTGTGEIKGYLNWPASPGTLAACRNIGTKCTGGRPYRTVWECGMRCTAGQEDYPARASVCAPSQRSAYQAGLRVYRTGGPSPVCRNGYQLSREVGTLEFNDPAWSMCRNTEKECELRPTE